jgi:DNA-binding IclR family transcriptional regulator
MTAVLGALQAGDWWTLRELSAATGAPEASVSARIRDLKKARFGSHKIESQYVRRGLWQYRMAE